MKDYLTKKLQEEPLGEIVQKCKVALNKGYLSDNLWEKGQIEKVRKCRDFLWFCRERKKAQKMYDKLCLLLENELPKIEKLNDPLIKLSRLVPLLKKALKTDGKRRAFDHTFNLQGNILERQIGQFRKFLQGKIPKAQRRNKINIWLSNLVNISPYKSYSYLELKDLLGLLILCPTLADFKKPEQITMYLKQRSKKDPRLARMLKNCTQKYARGSLESLSEKLLSYIQYNNQEQSILKQLCEKKKETDEKKKETIEEIKKILSPQEKSKFKELIEKITKLIFINECEDPFRNNNMDGLADYFLRKNVAMCLYQLKKIKTPEPLDYPQYFLLREAEKILKEKK